MNIRTIGLAAAAALLITGLAGAAPAPDSKRLGHAKDLIADEQWARAIVELQAAAADPKETNRDEALFWLAHSEHQAGDDSSALQTIATLERTAPVSKWVRPARSLRVEIAQQMRRDDVLWMLVAPPAPPAPPVAPPAIIAVRPASTPRAAVAPLAPVPPATPSPPAPMAIDVAPRPAARPPAMGPIPPHAPAPPAPPAPPMPGAEFWMPLTPVAPDVTLRLQALTGLLDAHSAQVIPLLREIALDRNSPEEARQAVFVLGQSRQPEARSTVVEVARDAAEPVRIAAVRELGRFEGPTISAELMQVYATGGTPRLKRQVVASLGERADNVSLLRIVRSEPEPTVRDFAILTLGRSGARVQLRTLYELAPIESRTAVLSALCTARDDDELIRIARTENNALLRQRARDQLRMLGTPKALKYLELNP